MPLCRVYLPGLADFLAQHGDYAIQDGNRYDDNADERFVCIFHIAGIDLFGKRRSCDN